MKRKEILLIIAVIIFAIVYNAVETGEVRMFMGACSINSRSLADSKHPVPFPQEEIRPEAGQSVTKVVIDNTAGEIDVKPSKDGTLYIEPVINVYHRDKTKADKFYKKVSLDSTVKDGVLSIKVGAQKKRFPYKRVRVSFKCFIPADMELELKNNYGNVSIEEAGAHIYVYENHGDLFVKNVASDLKVKSYHGLVRIYDITDQLDITTSHTKVKIRNVPTIRMNCSHSRVELKDIEDTMDLDTSHSVITLKNGGRFKADGNHTRMELLSVTRGVDIKNRHAKINMKEISGDVRVDGRHCRIRMADINAGKLTVSDTYATVSMDRISCTDLEVDLNHGNLDVQLDKLEEKATIKGDHTDIELSYAAISSATLDLTTSSGKIVNRADSAFKAVKEKRKRRLKRGEGKPLITVETKYGDILLKK
ncbi:MAG: DUF4097 domain-containing protein [bacterium]|nr:DUF4097 domain-containing protein [bacterium]